MLLGDILHNITDGIALAASFSESGIKFNANLIFDSL